VIQVNPHHTGRMTFYVTQWGIPPVGASNMIPRNSSRSDEEFDMSLGRLFPNNLAGRAVFSFSPLGAYGGKEVGSE